MKEIDYKFLISIINNGYDYIGMVTTPWHALSMVAAIKKIEAQKGHMKGIILINKNLGEKYLVDDLFFFNIDADVYYFNGKRTSKQFILFELLMIKYALFTSRSHSKKGKDFFILSHNHPNLIILSLCKEYLKNNHNLISVLCDEGVGTYTTDEKDRIEHFRCDGSSKLKILKNLFEERFLYGITIKHLRKNDAYLNYCMFVENGEIMNNSDMPEYIAKEVQEYAESVDFYYPIIEQDYVLLNTQYFTREEIVDNEKVMNLWKQVIVYYKRKGLEVWIKPHPRETDLNNYYSMGAKVIEVANVAQEVLFTKMRKPRYLIGLYSTTLVTAPVLNKVPSVCLVNLTLNDSAYTESYKRNTKKFVDRFRKITLIVNSINDLPE